MSSWRPKAAWETNLSDRQLAKIGLITQLEVQIYTLISITLKALEGLDLNQWTRLDGTPLEQLVKRVVSSAETVDDELFRLIRDFECRRPSVLPLRHSNVHSLWGWDPLDGKPKANYRRKLQKLEVDGLDAALEALASLSIDAKKIAIRAGHLIKAGTLKRGKSTKAPIMFIEGEWIQF